MKRNATQRSENATQRNAERFTMARNAQYTDTENAHMRIRGNYLQLCGDKFAIDRGYKGLQTPSNG